MKKISLKTIDLKIHPTILNKIKEKIWLDSNHNQTKGLSKLSHLRIYNGKDMNFVEVENTLLISYTGNALVKTKEENY